MTSTLTIQAVAEVASLSKERGQRVLAGYLGCNVDEYLQLRDSILLDFHYGNLMLAVNSGFTWPQSIEIFMLGKDMLQECTGTPLSEAIYIFQEKIRHLSNMISQEKLKLFTDYFFETFMKHYRLYQFVLTQGQEPMASEFDVCVIPPVECPKLKEAKALKVWEYEQKLEELERKEEECKASLSEQKQKEKAARESQKENSFTRISGDLNQEIISEMIRKASEDQSHHTQKLLQLEVEEKHEDLDFYLEKTALPRPAVLGAPPRTKAPPKLSARGKSSSKSTHKIGQGLEAQNARGSTRGSRSKAK